MPEALVQINSIAAGISVDNIDTDVIMPKRFLRTITREGLADGAFADLRFHENGSIKSDFILNQDAYAAAQILVVGDNFGCGSSREHAVWGLYQLGIRAIIGTTYGGIFFDNCRRNGLAAICLSPSERNQLLDIIKNSAQAAISISISQRSINSAAGLIHFEMPDEIQYDLLHGVDIIASTLQHADCIRQFEDQYQR